MYCIERKMERTVKKEYFMIKYSKDLNIYALRITDFFLKKHILRSDKYNAVRNCLFYLTNAFFFRCRMNFASKKESVDKSNLYPLPQVKAKLLGGASTSSATASRQHSLKKKPRSVRSCFCINLFLYNLQRTYHLLILP